MSNVIHGKTGKISDETVKRVQALLEERQYIPSMAGILLAQNSSKIIGVFLNDHEKYEGHTLDDVFIASSLNHLSTEIEKHNLFMMVKKAKKPEEIIQFASMWNMDGIVVIGFCTQDYAYLRNHMRIPFVIYDGFCDKPEHFCNITIDNYSGGYQVGSLFRKQEHKSVMCISDNTIGVDYERYQGFCAGFGSSSIDLFIIPMHKQERWTFYGDNLKKFRSVSAIFAVSDYYAIDLIHFLTENGLRVPQDICIAGFDDIPMCQMVSPTLTTVKQDGAMRAEIAITKLLDLRQHKETPTNILLPVTLVERGSTKR